MIYLGPNRTLRYERELELLPCSTQEESDKAFAWLTVALTKASQNPLMGGSFRSSTSQLSLHEKGKNIKMSTTG